jgi:hypothetical protein
VADWRLNPALTGFREAVNARYGARRDMESDGTIGDRAHSARTSDHNPDSDGSVDAWDMDVDVNGRGKPYAADVEALKKVFEAHESSSYWIHNDQIARRSTDWKRESYSYAGPGRNRHEKHVHWNTRQSRENSTAPWVLAGQPEVPDMTPDQAALLRDANYVLAGKSWPNPAGTGKVDMRTWAAWMTGAVKALATAVGGVDEATKAQLASDLDALSAQVAAVPDAVVNELGADSPEQIAERLQAVLGDKAAAVGAILVAGQA